MLNLVFDVEPHKLEPVLMLNSVVDVEPQELEPVLMCERWMWTSS